MWLTCNVNVQQCDFLDVKPGEWSLGLKNPNLVQNPFLFSQPNVIEK